MNFQAIYKSFTVWLAAGITAVYGFSQTAAGQALMKQYPRSVGFVTIIGVLCALIHTPKLGSSDTPKTP